MKRKCEFQGGVGRPEKYRPPQPCLGEFEIRPQNVHRSRYCKVCAPFAKRAINAENALARYEADPETFRARRRQYRADNPEAVRAQAREYRSVNKERVNATERARRSKHRDVYSAKQRARYAADPEKHRDQRRASRRRHLEESRARDRERSANMRRLAAEAEILRSLESKPKSWRRIVPLLFAHRNASNDEIQTAAGTNVTRETMRVIRAHCGVRGTAGGGLRKRRQYRTTSD